MSGQGAADAASRLNWPRGGSLIGNGVDTATGMFSLDTTPVSVQGLRALDFSLFYDSYLPPPGGTMGVLGPGWTHLFEARLEGLPGPTVTVYWDNNRRNTFFFNGADFEGLDEAVRTARLEQIGMTWRLVAHSGTTFRFDANGLLTEIENKVGQGITVQRDMMGRIVSVREGVTAKTVTLRYDSDERLQYLTDPGNRVTFFEYNGAGRLSAIHSPAELSEPVGALFPPIMIPDGIGNPFSQIPGELIRTINVSRTEPIGVVQLVQTSIGHMRTEDLQVLLRSPEGTEVNITALAEGSGMGVLDFGGVALLDFEGENPQGNWELVVLDFVPENTGTLNGFRLQFSNETFPTRFEYDGAGRLNRAIDAADDQLFANTYDGASRVISQDDGVFANQLAMFEYMDLPGGGLLTHYFNRLGQQYSFEHDSTYHLLSTSDPLGNTTKYTYDPSGQRTSVTGPRGNTTRFGYDGDGNVSTIMDSAPTPNVTQLSYNNDHNLTSITDAEGNTSNLQWNGQNMTRVTDARGHQDNKTYGGNGQLVGHLMEDGGGIDYTYQGGMLVGARRIDASGSETERAAYDELGRQTRITNAEQKHIDITYDDRGNVVSRTNPLGVPEFMEYDVRNRMIKRTDRNGNVTLIEFDGNGNMTRRTDALGNVTQFIFDGEDRLVRTIDPLGNLTNAEYDVAGRLVRQVDAEGNEIRKEYDAAGNEIAAYGPGDVKLLETVYDERNLPIKMIDALGQTSTTTYNKLGLATQIEDSGGNITQFEYDELGRLTKVTDPLGREFFQEYFSDDVVDNMADARGFDTSFSYDDGNRIIRVTPYSGTVDSVTYQYDERQLMTQERFVTQNVQRNYDYDDAGQLAEVSFVGGSNALPTISYDYDDNGNLTEVDAAGGAAGTPSIARTYDDLNRVASYTYAGDGSFSQSTIQYQYDSIGNLSRLTYPDGRSVTYAYDRAGRMIEVKDWSNRLTDFQYDANSRLIRIDFPNGTYRVMEYDDAGRITRRRDLRASGEVIVDYRYAYDNVGQVMVEQAEPVAAPYQPDPVTMTYDNINRLETYNGMEVSFDRRGNMSIGPLNGIQSVYQYDALNRLRTAGNTNYLYDEEDHLVAYINAEGTTRLVVDPHADLTRVLRKTAPGGAITRYVYGPGLLYDEVNGAIRVYHYDHRGSTVTFSGGAGSIVGTVAYGPYGEVAATEGQADSPFLFGGLWGVFTTPNGLVNMRLRWYSPEIKRFVNSDVHFGDIGLPSSLNRFSYAGGNPINFNDPSGQFLNVLVGAVVGAAVNVTATLVSSAITGQPISAGDLIGAAVGGAVTGGLIGACGPVCAAAGPVAMGVLTGGIGGAVGNATGQLIDLVIEKKPISESDWNEFGTETSASVIFGAIPLGGKGGRGALKAINIKPGKSISPVGVIPFAAPILSSKQSLKTNLRILGQKLSGNASLFRKGLAEAAPGTPVDIAFSVGQNLFSWGFGEANDRLSQPNQGSVTAITGRGLSNINQGRKGYYGEFAHWRTYVNANEQAGVPLPDNPNNILTAF